jgi:hypothetical protein
MKDPPEKPAIHKIPPTSREEMLGNYLEKQKLVQSSEVQGAVEEAVRKATIEFANGLHALPINLQLALYDYWRNENPEWSIATLLASEEEKEKWMQSFCGKNNTTRIKCNVCGEMRFSPLLMGSHCLEKHTTKVPGPE